VPLVKTGGLGDVSAALPAALAGLGHDVRVLLPGYPPVLDGTSGAREIARLTVLGRAMRLLESKLPSGVPLIIADAPTLFARTGGPYQDATGDDWNDNALRFGVLSKVAAILGTEASPLEWRPDVVHCNDWPTALAPLYLRFARGRHAASLLTIHNLAFQGIFSFDQVKPLELPPESVGLQGAEYYGKVSFLKGGIVYSSAVNTVSPTYAREIQTHELGFGMDGVLRQRSKDLFGVLNGIDTTMWNPQADPLIPAHYGPDTLDAKLTNKRALKQRLGLEGPHEVPLAAIVSRLTHQKGIDIIAEAVAQLAKIPMQVALVGAGDRELVEKLRAAQQEFPEHLGVYIGFDEQAAHLGRGGRGHVPHAVAIRAVRNEPDVFAALRNAARRQRHGRSRGHDPGRRDGLPHARAERGGIGRSGAARPGRLSRPIALAAHPARGHGARLRLGVGRPRIRRDLCARQIQRMRPISKRCESAGWRG
jgi:starch synthase